MAKPTLTNEMKSSAQKAIDFAQKYYQTKLNYNENGIKKVERIIDDLYDQLPRTKTGKLSRCGSLSAMINGICAIFGAYIGEVIRQHYGGRWKLESLASGEEIISLQIEGTHVSPTQKVYKRLAYGASGDLWSYYKMVRRTLKEYKDGSLFKAAPDARANRRRVNSTPDKEATRR